MKKRFLAMLLMTAVAVTAVLSCSKGFLEEEPRIVTISDLLNDSIQGPRKIIGAVYAKLYDWQQHSFSWIGITSIASDDADKGSDPGDAGTDKHDLDNWTFNPSSISFFEVWESNFQGVGRATYALKFLPLINMPAVDRDRYMGEAHMLRAYFYFNLVRTFGGVPKIDRVLETNGEIETATTRASAAEIYAFIESDLNEAIGKLPLSIPAAERGRLTKGAAQALMAKVALYQQKWGVAKAMSDAVINSGQYALLQDYAMIWREAGEFSSESIWEVNAVGTTPNRGIEGYFVTQAPRGGGGLGWGFNTPTTDLDNTYEPGDERKAATIMYRGQTLWDGFTINAGAPNPRYNYKSYVSKTRESFNGDDWNANKNLRILRLGEMYLIKAEAENELDQFDAAKAALDVIRDRAGLGPSTATDKASLREAIYRERRVEMAFEHDRLFDLRRTGRAEAVLQAHGKQYQSPKHDLYPIPQREIDLSNNRLEQNPFY